MSNLLYGEKSFNQILPQEKQQNVSCGRAKQNHQTSTVHYEKYVQNREIKNESGFRFWTFALTLWASKYFYLVEIFVNSLYFQS